MKSAKQLVSTRVASMSGYVPGEQPCGREFVKLNTNENPYPPSPTVVAAMTGAAAEGLRLYPSPTSDPLREKAAERYGVSPDQVLVGNGSDDILAICLRACVTEGDVVAYGVPTYSLYRTLAESVGARVVEIPAARGEIPEGLAHTGARVFFLCTPNSPTGAPLPLGDVARFARSVDALCVVDEAYADFGDSTALTILSEHPNMLVARTFSKSFSLAGARLGLGFACEELISELLKVKDSYNVSRMAVAAGVAALDDYGWMETHVARVRGTRERVAAAVRKAGYDVEPSATNFFWMDCAGEGGRAVYDRLREGGVLVRYFDSDGLRGGVRVTVGTDDEMDRFLEVLLAS